MSTFIANFKLFLGAVILLIFTIGPIILYVYHIEKSRNAIKATAIQKVSINDIELPAHPELNIVLPETDTAQH